MVRPSGIIHIFAALHAVTTIVCRLAGIADELFLTVLTMAMIVLVCLRKNLNVEFTAGIVIVVNLVSYLIGIEGAKLIGKFMGTELVSHAVTTVLTTEILGWGAIWLSNILGRLQRPNKNAWSPRIIWLLGIVGVVFLFRCLIIVFGEFNVISEDGLYSGFNALISNFSVCIIIFCINIIYVRYSRIYLKRLSPSSKRLLLAGFMTACVLLCTLLLGTGLPLTFHPLPGTGQLLQFATVSFIVEAVIFVLIYMTDFAWASRQDIRAEKLQRHKAQFEYFKLKQQVNPHFLFNSLNILDCLVCDGKNEEASTFIHKLAGMYRYMIQNEYSDKVSVEDEIKFAGMYSDLLKVRFPEGFDLKINVTDSVLGKKVVPCSVQMLLENALKHNAVSVMNPLKITISVDKDDIIVTNNICPKMSAGKPQSTLVGLNYIRQQYIDHTGKGISIFNDGKTYSVTIPLMD